MNMKKVVIISILVVMGSIESAIGRIANSVERNLADFARQQSAKLNKKWPSSRLKTEADANFMQGQEAGNENMSAMRNEIDAQVAEDMRLRDIRLKDQAELSGAPGSKEYGPNEYVGRSVTPFGYGQYLQASAQEKAAIDVARDLYIKNNLNPDALNRQLFKIQNAELIEGGKGKLARRTSLEAELSGAPGSKEYGPNEYVGKSMQKLSGDQLAAQAQAEQRAMDIRNSLKNTQNASDLQFKDQMAKITPVEQLSPNAIAVPNISLTGGIKTKFQDFKKSIIQEMNILEAEKAIQVKHAIQDAADERFVKGIQDAQYNNNIMINEIDAQLAEKAAELRAVQEAEAKLVQGPGRSEYGPEEYVGQSMQNKSGDQLAIQAQAEQRAMDIRNSLKNTIQAEDTPVIRQSLVRQFQEQQAQRKAAKIKALQNVTLQQKSEIEVPGDYIDISMTGIKNMWEKLKKPFMAPVEGMGDFNKLEMLRKSRERVSQNQKGFADDMAYAEKLALQEQPKIDAGIKSFREYLAVQDAQRVGKEVAEQNIGRQIESGYGTDLDLMSGVVSVGVAAIPAYTVGMSNKKAVSNQKELGKYNQALIAVTTPQEETLKKNEKNHAKNLKINDIVARHQAVQLAAQLADIDAMKKADAAFYVEHMKATDAYNKSWKSIYNNAYRGMSDLGKTAAEYGTGFKNWVASKF